MKAQKAQYKQVEILEFKGSKDEKDDMLQNSQGALESILKINNAFKQKYKPSDRVYKEKAEQVLLLLKEYDLIGCLEQGLATRDKDFFKRLLSLCSEETFIPLFEIKILDLLENYVTCFEEEKKLEQDLDKVLIKLGYKEEEILKTPPRPNTSKNRSPDSPHSIGNHHGDSYLENSSDNGYTPNNKIHRINTRDIKLKDINFETEASDQNQRSNKHRQRVIQEGSKQARCPGIGGCSIM